MVCKRGGNRFCLILFCLALFMCYGVSALPNCTVACGGNISTSCQLNQSLTGCTGNGLVIDTSNVVLDCAGYSIVGDNSGIDAGVNIASVNNVTVKNCNISFFATWGVLADGDNNTIDNNIIINASTGIVTTHSDNNFINNQIFRSSLGTTRGIYLNNGAGNNNLINNTIYHYLYGVQMASSSNNNLLANNTIYNNTDGIYMVSSNINTIYHNNIYENNQYEVNSDAAINLSYNNEGNYWGRSSCPYFIAGTDSNNVNVTDSYPYASFNGWLTGDPAVCCGDTITSDTTLTYNLTGCSGNGLNIVAAGVTLDCDGYAISGTGSGYGINISNADNVTVKNCVIHSFDVGGILAKLSNNVNILNNTIYNITDANAELISVSGNDSLYVYADVAGNNLTGGDSGIFCSYSSTNITGNDIQGQRYGIENGFACGVAHVIGNRISGCTQAGAFISSSHNVTNNNITGNNYGIWTSASSPKIYHNNIYNNTLNINSTIALEASFNSEGNYWGRSSCPVFIAGTDSNNVDVVDSYGYNSSDGWVTGDPADCTDPTWNQTPSSQSIDEGTAFSYQVNASDNVAIDTYFINDSTNFKTESSTWLIENDTTLSSGAYSLNVSVNDTSNNIISEVITITVQDTTVPTFSNAVNTSADFRINSNFTANITIDNSNLSSYIFSTNASGGWTNTSPAGISGTQYNASEQETILLAAGSEVCWYYWASDVPGNNASSSTYCFTVANTPPVQGTPTISGTYSTDDLVCRASATDADGGNVTYEGYWYLNGTQNESFDTSPTSYAEGTAIDVSTLNSSMTSAGDNWSCQVMAYDGSSYSSYEMSVNLTITAPALPRGGGGRRPCTDECPLGKKVCRDNSMFVCGNFDSDRCTEWATQDCPRGQTCENGECVIPACREDWICGEWSSCANEVQTRMCADWNKCGTKENMPSEQRACAKEEMPIEEEEIFAEEKAAPAEEKAAAFPLAKEGPAEEYAKPTFKNFAVAIVIVFSVVVVALLFKHMLGAGKK